METLGCFLGEEKASGVQNNYLSALRGQVGCQVTRFLLYSAKDGTLSIIYDHLRPTLPLYERVLYNQICPELEQSPDSDSDRDGT